MWLARFRPRCAPLLLAIVIALLAPAGYAAAASLKLHMPRRVKATKYFQVRANGTGKKRHNYLALFYTLEPSCPATYAAAYSASHTIQVQTKFVKKSFRVQLGPVHGGATGSGRFCAYLYPKASGTAWAYRKPEASASHRITFT